MAPLDKNSDSYKLVNDLKFCVIDLETTGGNHVTDRIIEIGMVRIRNLKITDKLNLLIDPEIKIPDFIQKLTSIKQKDVKNQPKILEVIDQIIEFIGDDILVAHNTSFDIPFINAVLKRLKRKELKNKVLCTNVMTKHLIPEITSSNLTYMSNLFDLNHKNAHRALDDAIASGELLIQYCLIFIEKGIKKINQLYYPKNKFELDRAHFTQEDSIESIMNKIKTIKTSLSVTFKGEQGLILAIIPTENIQDDEPIIKEYLEKLDWKMVTLKITKPHLETLIYFSSHYQKFSSAIQKELLEYLKTRYPKEDSSIAMGSLDFVLSNHLISKQVVAYSFLNMNTKINNVFKVPAQQKKMYQFLLSNSNRFESSQKGKRKTFIPAELNFLIEAYLAKKHKDDTYLYITRKDIKNGREHFISIVAKYTKEILNTTKFPTTHL